MSWKEDLFYLCAIPKESYEQLDHEGLRIKDLNLYDANLFNHYKLNEEWQQVDEELKVIRERKKSIEYKIAHDIKYKGTK